MRLENTWQEIRPFLHPESLQILQIPSSMTVLLLFSSPLSFSTGFRSEDWNGQSRSLVLCSVTHLCVVFEICVWIIVRLEDPNMAHYNISNSQSLIDFYLLVFDRIHDACVCRPASSSRQIRIIFSWLEILNYYPDGWNGNFHCSSSFSKATSTNLWSSIIFLCTSEIYSLVFLIVMGH